MLRVGLRSQNIFEKSKDDETVLLGSEKLYFGGTIPGGKFLGGRLGVLVGRLGVFGQNRAA